MRIEFVRRIDQRLAELGWDFIMVPPQSIGDSSLENSTEGAPWIVDEVMTAELDG